LSKISSDALALITNGVLLPQMSHELADAGLGRITVSLDRVVPSAEWLERIHDRWPLRPLAGHNPGETARRYAFKDGAGEIGLISSITEPFCSNCSRARVTADGVLHNCLFSNRGTNLRPFLTNSCDLHTLEQRIRSTWSIRQDQYSKNRHSQCKEENKIEMYQLGGKKRNIVHQIPRNFDCIF